MKLSKEKALLEILLQRHLLLPTGMPELRPHRLKIPKTVRVLYQQLSSAAKTMTHGMNLGRLQSIEARVEERLIVEHGWIRVDGSLLPPGKAVAAIAATRTRALNPELMKRLKDFSLMSGAYRHNVAKGVCTKKLPLPA